MYYMYATTMLINNDMILFQKDHEETEKELLEHVIDLSHCDDSRYRVVIN